MGLERQLIALCLCLMSYEFDKNKYKIFTIFCFGIGMLFHFSCVIFFSLFYFSKFLKIQLKIQLILIITFFMFMILKVDVISILLKILLWISEKLEITFLLNKIVFYTGNEFYSRNIGITKTFIIQFIIILMVFVLRKPKTTNEEKIYFFTTVYILISFLSSNFYVFDRLQSYFGVFSIILISYSLNLFNKKNILFFMSWRIFFMSNVKFCFSFRNEILQEICPIL